VNVSYLEIYNDSGYDLLDENHATKSLFDLPKVRMYEVSDEQFVLKNLSVHRAENEEDALNLLFIGDTNRVVSETPKNDASTRSHCIFIIHLEGQKMGEDVKTTSKLHLVDLSGSERPSQTGIDGKTLEEAKNINLSLHFLAQVIEHLNEKAKGNPVAHIPYRNSMMTMVLRDSLGGNCKTKMIATVSLQ
jgi:kinesin family protein 6/9